MPLVGKTATSRKPVRKVAAMPPRVPMPDSRPTTEPVSARLASCSLTTMGGTADSSAAGITTATAASSSTLPASAPVSTDPAKRTSGRTATTRAPPATSNGAISRRGSVRSASAPPVHAPTAMAASAKPMIAVLVCRVIPT
jgi:hypothetical protein